MTIPIHIWSDIVCPWCFVGKRRFERALAQFGAPVSVTWHSFELDPDGTSLGADSLSAPERLAKKHRLPLEQAERMMDQMKGTGIPEGIAFRLKEGKTRSSFDAHRLLHFALEHGKQDELKERLFRAHFEEALDVGDPEVLRALANEVGLPSAESEAVLSSDRFADDVRSDEADAREIGISGVPFFIIGRYGVSGAQASETLLNVLKQALSEGEKSPDDSAQGASDGESCDVTGC